MVPCTVCWPDRCWPLPHLPHLSTPVSRWRWTLLRPGARPGPFRMVCAVRQVFSSTSAGQLPLPTISPLCERNPALRGLRRNKLAVQPVRASIVEQFADVGQRCADEDLFVCLLHQRRGDRVELARGKHLALMGPVLADVAE